MAKYRLKNSDDIQFLDDCLRIQNALEKQGYELSLGDCQALWEKYSDTYFAGWMMLDGYSDSDIVNIALKYIEKDI